jgi:hypothetical protein
MSFELTLNRIETDINRRLRPGYTRIWVQGNIKGGTATILFTPFSNSGYTMHTMVVKNFRNYRPDGNLQEELDILNRQIESFRTLLENYVVYE